MHNDNIIETVRKKFERLTGVLDEQQRCQHIGHGGQTTRASQIIPKLHNAKPKSCGLLSMGKRMATVSIHWQSSGWRG